ncbi:MAG: radical SAM protein [bacterium]
MNILLVNPSLQEAEISHYKKKIEKNRGVYAPLGLCYIASALKEKNHQVEIIDCDTENNYVEKIKNSLKYFNPDVVGFYSMTWTYRQSKNIAREIKKINPQIKIIIGGPQVTTFPKFSIDCHEFDFGVIGEGEITSQKLFEALEKNNPVDQIKGLVFKKNSEIIINPKRELIKDLDSIPFPARKLLLMNKYFDIFTKKKKFATLIASRGCPFKCVFCDRDNRMGRQWRVRSPENIIKEIKLIQKQYNIDEFMFFDDNLTSNKEWIYQLCKLIEKNNLKIIWECRTRVDLVDKNLLETMKKAGCYRIRFGFESGNNEILKIIQKGITVEQSLLCAKICKHVGMEMFGYFMMGSPYETEETLKQTLDLALKINPDFAIFSKTILIPNTELFDWAVENNYIKKDYWEKYLLGEETNGAPTINSKELSEETVNQYISLANKKFYLRFKYLLKRLTSIRNWQQFFSQLKMAKELLFK